MDPRTEQWALVTGASAGIGSALARELAAKGYNLVLVARREDRLTQLSKELALQYRVQCHYLRADLVDADACQAIFRFTQALGITISFLANNAGYGVPGLYQQADWAKHKDSLKVLVESVCELSYLYLPAMQQQGNGYILNVASLAGFLPGSVGHTLYSASKAFLIKFSESLALENRTIGVRVCASCPGFTYTEFHDVTGLRELVSKMPSYMWMQADTVATQAVAAVQRGDIVCVHGRFNKVMVLLNRLLPQRLVLWAMARQSKRFRNLD